MSFLDKIASSIMPAASDQERAEARQKAQELSQSQDWLEMVLDHHRLIEGAFDRALNATASENRIEAARELAMMLTGHANAEESVIYPAVVEYSGKAHAAMAFEEQAAAKINMALLENIDPMSDDWREKLEHIQAAVAQHVYQEESSWFPDVMQNAPGDKQRLLTDRYAEEFERYCGNLGSKQPSRLAPIA